MPFEEIATILDRTPAATRQLASRARRKVQEAPTTPEPDLARQRAVVDAFFGAARAGDLDGLVAVLDPDVVLHGDSGLAETSRIVRGAEAVAGNAIMFSPTAGHVAPGADQRRRRRRSSRRTARSSACWRFVVADGRIVAIDALNDLDRLAALDLSVLD